MFLVINFNPYLLNNFFEVKDIRINGTEKTNPDELRQILTPNLNNLISFDKGHAKFLLEQVGWVKRVNIKKIYPNTLIINIIETDPFAIYYDNQNNYLIDIDGQIISSNPDINVYKNLLIVRGEEAKTKLNEIIKEINIYFPDVRNRINELEFIEKRRWNLFLSGNLLIKLPDTEIKESLNNLKKLFEDKQVLESNIIEVDLRIKGRAVIKVDGEQVRFGLEEVLFHKYL
jgi:cell division protein FtsQ